MTALYSGRFHLLIVQPKFLNTMVQIVIFEFWLILFVRFFLMKRD